MSKTAPIPDDIHELIIDKQIEMRRKHKISVKISDIIAACVTDSIKTAERFFGVNGDKDTNIKEIVPSEKNDAQKTDSHIPIINNENNT